MKSNVEQFGLRVISGEARGLGASLLRGAMSAVEPFYSAVVSYRNQRFDVGKKVVAVPRPVISVGNLTAGGTGKTPVVRWLCESLRKQGHRPAVLMRGYRAKPGERGDEQAMLGNDLNTDPDSEPIIVHANPVRFEGAMEVLREHPCTDLFVLDDGFQHRRLHRDFDLVLIDAGCPFGYGHVHPRGLLREPVRGIARAHAVVITRADSVDETSLTAIASEVRKWNPAAPVYRASHRHTGFRRSEAAGRTALLPLDSLVAKRAFVFCAIGRPQAFLKQVESLSGLGVGHRVYRDHHAYTADDLAQLVNEAQATQADVLVTTEKDWVKLAPLADSVPLPVWRVELAIEFADGDEQRLLRQLNRVLRLDHESRG